MTSTSLPVEPLSFKPHMTKDEMEMFADVIKGARSMLEYGCGGSTVLAAHLGVERIVSVDSDKAWLDKVAGTPEVQRIRFSPLQVDLGPLGDWGMPLDLTQSRKWHHYYVDVWDAYQEPFDVVFVDGRFRVACVLYSLMRMAPHSTVIIHDFWSRKHYHVVLKYLICEKRVDNIGIFQRSPSIDHVQLARDLVCHAVDCN